mgnify:FL=1
MTLFLQVLNMANWMTIGIYIKNTGAWSFGKRWEIVKSKAQHEWLIVLIGYLNALDGGVVLDVTKYKFGEV